MNFYQKDERSVLRNYSPKTEDNLDYLSIHCKSPSSRGNEKKDLQHYKVSEKLTKEELKRTNNLGCEKDCFNCKFEDCKIHSNQKKRLDKQKVFS